MKLQYSEGGLLKVHLRYFALCILAAFFLAGHMNMYNLMKNILYYQGWNWNIKGLKVTNHKSSQTILHWEWLLMPLSTHTVPFASCDSKVTAEVWMCCDLTVQRILTNVSIQWCSLIYFSGYTVLYKYMDHNGNQSGASGCPPPGKFCALKTSFPAFW